MALIVIGFNWPVEHDHTVAVIQDGRLVFAAEEERFTRHKHSIEEPPLNALKAAYRYLMSEGIKPKDVDAYAVNWDPHLFPRQDRLYFFREDLVLLKRMGVNISWTGSAARAALRLAPSS